MANTTIKGNDIKRLVTRFQYKKQEMCFEILLRLSNATELVLFLKTTDYGTFKKVFDELMTIRAENKTLQIPQASGGNSTLHISAA